MEAHQLSADQRARIDALQADCERQLARVQVDRRVAIPQLHNHGPVERRHSDEDVEIVLTFDMSGIVETLRRLPDGAGTSAFVSAYNVAHPVVQ
ncbi:MAG: hypothetical protein ABJE47_16620 [bacterium]